MTTESRIPQRAEKSPLQSKFQRHQVGDVEVGRPSSRLSSFSPFRRSTHFSTPSQHIQHSPAQSFSSGWSGNQNSIGGIGEAPQAINRTQPSSSSSSSSKIPFKPPKPAALRVKKAKALSISLLGGGGGSGGSNIPEEPINRLYRPQSSLAMRDTPKTAIGITNDSRSTQMTPMTLQEALAADDGGDRYPSMPKRMKNKRDLPPRSSSALDFYRANGPSQGLSNREFPSPVKRYHLAPFEDAPTNEDELVIIGAETTSSPRMHQRRRSASFSSNTALDSDKSLRSAPLPQSPQGWPLDTARELLSASSKGPLSSPPVHSRNGFDEFKVFDSQVTNSHLPLRSNGSGVTATPFLNTFNARAQMQPTTSPKLNSESSSFSNNSPPQSRIPRRKAAPAPLGKADILRSIQGASSDSSNPSSPLSIYGNLPSTPRRTPSHKRNPSSSEINDSTKHFQLPRQRNRSQSHVFGAAELGTLNADLNRLDNNNDFRLENSKSKVSDNLPQHPLSARSETFSDRQMLTEGPVLSARTTSKTSNIVPPPLRKNRLTRLGTQETHEQGLPGPGRMQDERYRLPGMTTNGSQPTSIQGWGQQIGGMGAAVGKRGWDMFKQWNHSTNNNNNNSNPPSISRPQNSKLNQSSRNSISTNNEATRKWISALEGPQSVGKAGGQNTRSGVFGMPLHEAVLYTRLGSSDKSKIQSPGRAQITALDLGSEFKIDLPGLKAPSPIEAHRKNEFFERRAVSRGEARMLYLPGLVVRCIEAIESFGIDEEGIYRLSGRSTHTTKLRQIFDAPLPRVLGSQRAADLRLADIGPADLDLNSVCSLLKSYLRELPDNLIPEKQAMEMNANVAKQCGIQAVGPPLLPGVQTSNGNGKGEFEQAMAIKVASLGANASSQDQANVGEKIANAILPIMSQLPAVNWYLLRELSMHLADLTKPEVHERTRMPLSNLCLVLAPTLALSVPLMRAMVEESEIVFGQSCPALDSDLDNSDAKLSRSTDSNITNRYIPPANNLGLKLPVESSNRMSMATVTDKRKSTSSVMTLQPGKTPKASKNSTLNGESYLSVEKVPPVQSLLEEDDPDLFTSPIAAQFIRQRKASIAGSLDCLSLKSEDSLGSGPKTRIHPALIQQDAGNSSNISQTSSVTPSTLIPQSGTDTLLSDHDSIHSSGPSDDYSSAASSLRASISSGSVHGSSPLLPQSDQLRSSSSNGSISALDRPRPKTGSTAKLFSAIPKIRTNAPPHSRVASNASAGTISIQSIANSTNSNGSNEGPATPVAQKRDFMSGGGNAPLINVNSISSENEDAGTKTVRTSPDQKKFVDDSPMDMQAIRRYWSKQM